MRKNGSTLKGLNLKRSNERSEIIAPGETRGMRKNGSTLKGLNLKRSNERSEIIAPGETQ
jgi:ribosomal protein L30/L7E